MGHAILFLAITTTHLTIILPACVVSLRQDLFMDATKNLQPLSSEGRLFQIRTRSNLACAIQCSINERCLTFVFTKDGEALTGTCDGHSKIVYSTDPAAPATGWKSYVRKRFAGQCGDSGLQILVDLEARVTREVSCDKNWTVILRRQDGSVDFYLGWEQYTKGFGNTAELWFGLEDLHKLTSARTFDLKADLTDWEGISVSATYTNVTVASAADKYRLHVDFVEGTVNDSLSDHNDYQFTTRDQDNDIQGRLNCAHKMHGAWWYQKCASTNLCGDYKTSSLAKDKSGLSWKSWHGTNYSLKYVQLSIRPTSTYVP